MTPEETSSTSDTTSRGDGVDSTENSTEYSPQRIELSLVLEFEPEHFLGADGELNETQMVDEALTYAEKAAYDGAFDIDITPISETDE
jgi:hypothetical protein